MQTEYLWSLPILIQKKIQKLAPQDECHQPTFLFGPVLPANCTIFDPWWKLEIKCYVANAGRWEVQEQDIRFRKFLKQYKDTDGID